MARELAECRSICSTVKQRVSFESLVIGKCWLYLWFSQVLKKPGNIRKFKSLLPCLEKLWKIINLFKIIDESLVMIHICALVINKYFCWLELSTAKTISESSGERNLFSSPPLCGQTAKNHLKGTISSGLCITLHWTTRAERLDALSPTFFLSSSLSSSSSDLRLFSLSSGDSLSSVESSTVLSLLSSGSPPSLLSARGERMWDGVSRASPRRRGMLPSRRRRCTMLWGCCVGTRKEDVMSAKII